MTSISFSRAKWTLDKHLAPFLFPACNHKIGQAMKKKYKKEMDYVYAVINEMDRKLDRPIRDLDDVRMIMETLGKIREQEVDMVWPLRSSVSQN